MCRDKGVNAMERYWSTILAFIWPKLQKIIQLNVQSVKDCDPQKMKSLDLRPHFVSIFLRPSSLILSLYKIHASGNLAVHSINI